MVEVEEEEVVVVVVVAAAAVGVLPLQLPTPPHPPPLHILIVIVLAIVLETAAFQYRTLPTRQKLPVSSKSLRVKALAQLGILNLPVSRISGCRV